MSPQPVLPGERGAPRWPAGLVGSMTHCEGYCAAALVRATDLASIGIDAEPHEPLPEGVLDAVSLPTELTHLRELTADGPGAHGHRVHWDRLLFSAKESVYKAWFPLTGKWLDFSEADIEFTAGPGPHPNGTFRSVCWCPDRSSTAGNSGTSTGAGPCGTGCWRRRSVCRTSLSEQLEEPLLGARQTSLRQGRLRLGEDGGRHDGRSVAARRYVEGCADGVQQPQVGLYGGALTVGQYGGRHRTALPMSASSLLMPAPPSLPPATDNPAAVHVGSLG